MDLVKRQDSYDVLWLSIGLVPLILIALLLPLTPHDYWWYLRLGEDVLRLGRIPSVEMYSFTQLGESVVNQPWLSAVIFWVVYNDGGLNLTFLLRAICIAAAYGLLWNWMRQMGVSAKLASILIIIAGLAGSNNWSFRPQLFAYPLFALTVLILWQWQKGGTKFMWLLPVIAVLWANLHESFLMMFILEGAALIFGQGDRKKLIIFGGLSLVATLITPYDVGLWVSLFQSFTVYQHGGITTEWYPPANSGWQMNIFYAGVLAFFPLASLSSKRLTLLEWVWLLGLLWMAFSGLRYVIFGIFMLTAFSAYLLADWSAAWLDRPARVNHPALNYVFSGVLLLLSMTALPQVRSFLGVKSAPIVSVDTPVAATNWLSNHPDLPGPLWSDITFSSYLIFALPSRSVWIDTRYEMAYTATEIQRYLAVANAEPGWEGILNRSGINLLMISVNGEPFLLQALGDSNEWCKQYQDPIAAIYARRPPNATCP
ncbi:MAG: hypothetical protein HY258_02730 [Chloroflexi bacterium]|nr:hypothetical protein [Chloroflexota bacterium]